MFKSNFFLFKNIVRHYLSIRSIELSGFLTWLLVGWFRCMIRIAGLISSGPPIDLVCAITSSVQLECWNIFIEWLFQRILQNDNTITSPVGPEMQVLV